jgi:hypothetical protein
MPDARIQDERLEPTLTKTPASPKAVRRKSFTILNGNQRHHTGVVLTSQQQHNMATKRLTEAKKPVADSRRVQEKDVKHSLGNLVSYQWNSNGKLCHGFKW